MGSGGNSASSRFNWHKVWTGVKCHFSSAHHHNQYVVGKLSISRVQIGNFTRIGRKTKKLRLSINPARRQWPGTTHKKGLNYHFSSPEFDKRYVVGKLSLSRVQMWNFTRIGHKAKKLQLSINPARRQWPGTTHKKVLTTTFLRRNSTSQTSLESSWSRKLKYAVQAGLAKRWKNDSSFKFLPENLEKFRSTNLYDAPLEGSTIFLYRSSLGRMSMESCRSAELKYAIFSGTCRKTKKLQCSKLFLSTVSKHGLLEGSTFLYQYSSITRTPLESSRLGELNYAISAG